LTSSSPPLHQQQQQQSTCSYNTTSVVLLLLLEQSTINDEVIAANSSNNTLFYYYYYIAESIYSILIIYPYQILSNNIITYCFIIYPLSWLSYIIQLLIWTPIYWLVKRFLWDCILYYILYLPIVFILHWSYSLLVFVLWVEDLIFNPIWFTSYCILDWIVKPMVWFIMDWLGKPVVINIIGYPISVVISWFWYYIGSWIWYGISYVSDPLLKITLSPLIYWIYNQNYPKLAWMLEMLIVGTHVLLHGSYYLLTTSFLAGSVLAMTKKVRIRGQSSLIFGPSRGLSPYGMVMLKQHENELVDYVVDQVRIVIRNSSHSTNRTTMMQRNSSHHSEMENMNILLIQGGSGVLIHPLLNIFEKNNLTNKCYITVMDTCKELCDQLAVEYKNELGSTTNTTSSSSSSSTSTSSRKRNNNQSILTIIDEDHITNNTPPKYYYNFVIAHHSLSSYSGKEAQNNAINKWIQYLKNGQQQIASTNNSSNMSCFILSFTHNEFLSETQQQAAVGGNYHISYPLTIIESLKNHGFQHIKMSQKDSLIVIVAIV
jgi:hypothetical protein